MADRYSESRAKLRGIGRFAVCVPLPCPAGRERMKKAARGGTAARRRLCGRFKIETTQDWTGGKLRGNESVSSLPPLEQKGHVAV